MTAVVVWFVSLVALGVVGRHVMHETAVFIGKRWDRRLAIDEREVTLRERAQEITTRSLVPPAIPPELMRRITRWQDPIAQDSERAVILALYDEFRDQPEPWATVKAHLPHEPDDHMVVPFLT